MIIDKLAPFWTEADRAETDRISKEIVEISERISSKQILTEEETDEAIERLQALQHRRDTIREDVEGRYIKSFSRKPSALYDDVKEIVAQIEREDFINANANMRETIAKIERTHPEAIDNNTRPLWEDIKRATEENYVNCYNYILGTLIVQEEALKRYYKDQTKIESRLRKIIEGQVSKWYVRPEPLYLPMLHGRATDAFAFMNSAGIELNRIGDGIVQRKEVKLVIESYNELNATLGINEDKLFSTATANFTMQNSTKGSHIETEVHIPLKDYARKLGYEVDEHPTDSPEAERKEKQRAKNALKNARKSIQASLNLLYKSSLEWEEIINGKPNDFSKRRILDKAEIVQGYIVVNFAKDMSEYLIKRNLVTQYPNALIGIDARKPNAYYIGRKLAEHYYIDNNQKKGTYNRIGVKSLLDVTALPTYEDVIKKDRRAHWVDRIKEPFEKALDELTGGLLSDWKYTHAKGVDLTEEEAYTLTDYEDFSKLYITYELIRPEDQTDRIEEKDRRRSAQRKKPPKRRPKQKKEEEK